MNNDLLPHFLNNLCHRLLVWVGFLALFAISISPHPDSPQARESQESKQVILLAQHDHGESEETTRVE